MEKKVCTMISSEGWGKVKHDDEKDLRRKMRVNQTFNQR